jgi:uncharacterized protein YndB with AHSA1/START domain
MTDLGTVSKAGGRVEARWERRLPHSIEKVWAAITEPDELRGWLADADIDLREGGDVELRWLNGDAVLRGRITRLEPGRLLEYEGEPHGMLRFELAPDGDGTRLVFTNAMEAPDYPDVALAGWHTHLDMLEDALGGHPVTDWENWPLDRWKELHVAYGGDGNVPSGQQS